MQPLKQIYYYFYYYYYYYYYYYSVLNIIFTGQNNNDKLSRPNIILILRIKNLLIILEVARDAAIFIPFIFAMFIYLISMLDINPFIAAHL